MITHRHGRLTAICDGCYQPFETGIKCISGELVAQIGDDYTLYLAPPEAQATDYPLHFHGEACEDRYVERMPRNATTGAPA